MTDAAFVERAVNSSPTSSTEHSRWGLGHFVTSTLQKGAVGTAGLTVQRDTLLNPASSYTIKSSDKQEGASFDVNLEQLCPETITHDGNKFKGKELRAFLDFLAHPIEQSIQKEMTGHFNNKSLLSSGKDFAKALPLLTATPFIGAYKWMTDKPLSDSQSKAKSDALERVHQVMNWMTSHDGQITVEHHHHDHDHDDHDHGGLCDCHALSEAILEKYDAYREQLFGSTSTVNCEYPLAMIPGAGIDTQRGFYFDINKTVLFEEFPKNSPKAALQSLIKSAFEKAGYVLEPKQSRIYLSAEQLYTLTNEIAFHPDANEMVHDALNEEEQDSAFENIEADIQALEKTSRLRQLQNANIDPKIQLEAMRVATTALTPLVNPELLNALWGEYNVQQREISPFPQIADEVSRLHNAISQQISKGELGAESVQAIVNEFPSTIGFLKNWARESELPEIVNIFDQVGAAQLSIADDFMEDHHQKALELFRRAQGKGDSAMKHLAKSSLKSAWTVIKDTWSTVSENKQTAYKAIAFSASIFTLTHPSVIGPVMQALQSNQPQSEEVYILGDEGFEAVEVEIEAVPDTRMQHADGVKVVDANDAAIQGIQKTDVAICGEGGKVMHYHFSPNGAIPHCYFNDKLKDITAGMIDKHDIVADTLLAKAGLIDHPTASVSHFSEHARSKINGTLNFWLVFNLIQVVAHGAFYYNMSRRGRRHGLAANAGVANLIAEFTNSLSSMAKHTPGTLPAVAATLGHHLFTDTDLMTITMNAFDMNTTSDISSVLMSMFIAGGAASLIKKYPKVADQILKMSQAIEYDANDQETLEKFAKLSESIGYGATIENRISEALEPEDLSMKIAGIKESFALSKENIAATLESLIAFEIALDHAGDKIGLDDKDEKSVIRRDLDDVIVALESFAAGESYDKYLIEQKLSHIMAAQARYTGEDTIYQMLVGENAKPNSLALLERHGAQQHRRHVYGDIILNHDEKLKSPYIQPDDWVISKAAISMTSAWGDLSEAIHWTRARYSATPDTILTTAKIAAGSWLAVSYGADVSGSIQVLSDVMASGINLDSTLTIIQNTTGMEAGSTSQLYANALEATASFEGDIASYALPTVNFGVYNIYDDIILTDTVGGLFFLNAMGVAGGYYMIDRGYKPVKNIVGEATGWFEAEKEYKPVLGCGHDHSHDHRNHSHDHDHQHHHGCDHH